MLKPAVTSFYFLALSSDIIKMLNNKNKPSMNTIDVKKKRKKKKFVQWVRLTIDLFI